MFKKLKDKIAEEVKSSPQRIQQFAQAAQAAVTSASSSISDISNNDLFSIADDDTPQNTPRRAAIAQPTATTGFQDVNLMGASSSTSNTPSPLKDSTGSSENNDSLPPLTYPNHHPNPGNTGIYPHPAMNSATRVRKLSNSSNASDVSFRLPSYESPGGMYHLQSDLESASEMEDAGSIPAQLERVSKEQLYSAYRRVNEKYNKYRGRYADLARHYKNLERENAKARAVLVETQDKALRRISELREQCALEQSAKAHLESALRLELDEKNMKIESLNTKIKLLQSFSQGVRPAEPVESNRSDTTEDVNKNTQNTLNNGESTPSDNHEPLIDLSPPVDISENKTKSTSLEEDVESKHSQEIFKLNDKLQKLEQLLAKCKEAIKTQKEKNSQVTSELQILSIQMEKKTVENDQLKAEVGRLEAIAEELKQSKEQIDQFKSELDGFEVKKAESIAAVQSELKSAKEEITKLNSNIEVLKKREEENAISLAENKLSIHKELESKENEIKVLKDRISAVNLEIKTNESAIKDLKAEVKTLELERNKMKDQMVDFDSTKEQLASLENKLMELKNSYSDLESKCSSLKENIKCKDLELKQEIDEKLAVKDRNNFLEGRNKHLSDEASKKNKQIVDLEREIMEINKAKNSSDDLSAKYEDLSKENVSLKSEFNEMLRTKEEIENELNIVNSKCRDLEDSLSKLTNNNGALNSDLHNLKDELTSLCNDKVQLENNGKRLADEIMALQDEHLRVKESLELQVKELSDRLKLSAETSECQKASVIEEIQQEVRKKIDENVKIMEELNRVKNENEEMKADKSKYQSKLFELDDVIKERNQLKNIYEELLKENNKFVMKLADFDSALVDLKEAKNLNHELLAEKNILEERVIKFNEISKNLAELTMEKEQLSNEKLTFEKRIEGFVTEGNILKEECEQLRNDKKQLEDRVAALEIENSENNSKRIALVQDIQQLQTEIVSINESHSQILSQKHSIEEKIAMMEKSESLKRNELATSSEESKAKIQELHSEKDKMICEKADLLDKIKNLELEIEASRTKCKEFSDNNEVWQVKLSNILDENNSLQEKCGKLKQEKDVLSEKLTNLESKVSELESLKKKSEETVLEIEFLNMRISQLDKDLSVVTNEKAKVVSEKDSVVLKLKESDVRLNEFKNNISKLKTELEEANKEKLQIQSKLDEESSQKDELLMRLNASRDKSKEVDDLIREKATLLGQLSELQEKYKNLESGNSEEMDNLQTANSDLNNRCEKLELKCRDFEELSELHSNLKADNENMIVKMRVLEKIEAEYKTLLEEKHNLKSDVSKLMSDIEGLQTHLKKVSKDNSQLNDRIRELEANGDIIQMSIQQKLEADPNVPNATEMQTQLNKLTEANSRLLEELKSTENLQNKILDLERQNSILIDEKLELEDQISSSIGRQHRMVDDRNVDRDLEFNRLRSQCKELMDLKMDLEGRLADMELISRSGDSSIRALEQKNERLKLTNDKLERRLDEALVSLNHIRTLEENTELEYLRNILYEYLTGPTNNNMVLAKVLAAVVKFDQRQTQIVLEREKEKQGLLGQLGLL